MVKRHFALMAASLLFGGFASGATGSNWVSNGDFVRSEKDGVPTGWTYSTRGHGTVQTRNDGNLHYVEIGIKDGPEDCFIQQTVPLCREGDGRAIALRLFVRYRYEGIVPGSRGYQKGKIQGRFKKSGADFGAWIDLANLEGSKLEWSEARRQVSVPDGADGLMLRLGFYGTKAGRLEVSMVEAVPVTEAEQAAERARYRPAEPYGEPVSDERYGRIRRGINVNGWFCQPWNQTISGQKGGFTKEFLRAFITEKDIEMIRAMGFDHIRLPVDPVFLCDLKTGDLKTELLPELDRAIAMIRSAGLAVMVDVHPKSPGFKSLSGNAQLRESFVAWWGRFAKHLAETTDPEWVFLELMNEPGGQKFWANQSWQDYQDRLITAVRASAPKHTLVANGGAYMLAGELGRVRPHPDRNVIWAVHYYEPSQFTHQGARWMKVWYHPLRDVPWPFAKQDVEPTIARLREHKAKDQSAKVLRKMAEDGIGTVEHMDREIARIAQWGRDNGIRIHIGEYGVLDAAPRESRLRYLAAINAAFERNGLARAMWNYGAGSAYSCHQGPDEPGRRTPDSELVRAIGQGKNKK